MFNLKHWLNLATNPQSYIWVKATLVKETYKALLIKFDDKQIWFPKAWILHLKRSQHNHTINIKISQYYWIKKFS